MKQIHDNKVEKGTVHLFFVPTLFVVMAAFLILTASFVFGQTFNPPHTIGIPGTSGAVSIIAGSLRLAPFKKLFWRT